MLQNRVDPWGRLVAVSDRGSLMGNRGILHDAENRIIKNWAHKSWVTCLLSYKEVKRPKPFSPGNYSELFFLDEATAFAAGHRPCTYCQRKRSNEFKSAWLAANASAELNCSLSLKAIDARLHGERAAKGGEKVTYKSKVSSLPNGTIFEFQGTAYLVNANIYIPWSFQGYGNATPISVDAMANVLTPRSVVAAFEQGFAPRIHSRATT